MDSKEIVNPPKSWWSGDERVEPFMYNVNTALNRVGLTGAKHTDVYNRAYEAVHKAIKHYADGTPLEELVPGQRAVSALTDLIKDIEDGKE